MSTYTGPTDFRMVGGVAVPKAEGGRVGYADGSDFSKDRQYKLWEKRYKKNPESILVTQHEKFKEYKEFYDRQNKAKGGRIGYQDGTPSFEEYMRERRGIERKMNIEQMYKEYLEDLRKKRVAEQKTMAAEGGRIGYAMGDSAEDNAMQAAGIMNLPLNRNKAGVTELDLRKTGGFIPPVGIKESHYQVEMKAALD